MNLSSQKGFAHILVILLVIVGILTVSSLGIQKNSPSLTDLVKMDPWIFSTEDLTPETYLEDYKKSHSLSMRISSLFNKVTQPLGDLLSGVNLTDQNNIQAARSSTATSTKPNIIIILTDDQPPNTTGLADNLIIKTPNIDSLGNPGFYLKNTYSPEGICSPSRASIWTGKLPHNHGVHAVSIPLPADQLTFPELLQSNGYNTAMMGKCHLGDPTNPQLYTRGFDTRLIALPDNGTVPDWYNYDLLRNGVIEHHTEYITNYLTDEATKYITSKAKESQTTGKPFFLWLAQPAPHLPTTPPTGSNRYSLSQIPLPVSIADDLSTKPPQQVATKFHKGYQDLGPEGTRAKLKDAYEVISNLDDSVGKIKTALAATKAKDNTIIIYMADNGLMYGEHQIYQKGPFFYEEQVKTPMIVYYPKLITSKKTSDALVSNMDLMPTLLDLAGISKPTNIQGQSFLNLLKGQTTTHRNSLFFEYHKQAGCLTYPMRGVLMNGYKFVHYFNGTYSGFCNETYDGGLTYDGRHYELYNLAVDPFEMNNIMKRTSDPADDPLARMLKDPVYGSTVEQLRKELASWQTDTQDPNRNIFTNLTSVASGAATLKLDWNTSLSSTSEIEYQPTNCSTCTVLKYNDLDNLVATHSATLNNLQSGTSYNFKVYSIGGNSNGGYTTTTATPQ